MVSGVVHRELQVLSTGAGSDAVLGHRNHLCYRNQTLGMPHVMQNLEVGDTVCSRDSVLGNLVMEKIFML